MKCTEPWKKSKSFWRTHERPFVEHTSLKLRHMRPKLQLWDDHDCIGIFTAALRNKKLSQILITNTSPYFQSALLAIWPLIMLKRSHFSELSVSRFTHKRSTRLHTPLPNARFEKRKSNLKITRRPQEVSFHFEIFHYLPSFFLLRPLLILDESEHELSKPKQKAVANNTDTRFDNS